MDFGSLSLSDFIPSYLSPQVKERLKQGLHDFYYRISSEDGGRNYEGFYSMEGNDFPKYLMQSDLLNSIKTVDWDTDKNDFISGFYRAMLVSNTCDITEENVRSTNIKNALFAPIIPVKEVLDSFAEEFNPDQVKGFYNSLKKQEHSNLFYLPPNHKNGKDYIVFLDKIHWLPASELTPLTLDLNKSRFISLSTWGYYLFVLKLSFHLCRLEEYDGRNN
jgi:hypothetical protein